MDLIDAMARAAAERKAKEQDEYARKILRGYLSKREMEALEQAVRENNHAAPIVQRAREIMRQHPAKEQAVSNNAVQATSGAVAVGMQAIGAVQYTSFPATAVRFLAQGAPNPATVVQGVVLPASAGTGQPAAGAGSSAAGAVGQEMEAKLSAVLREGHYRRLWQTAPDAIAPGHNPHKVTNQQVGPDHRLLSVEEHAYCREQAHDIGAKLFRSDLWISATVRWASSMVNGASEICTYRVPSETPWMHMQGMPVDAPQDTRDVRDMLAELKQYVEGE